MEEKVFELIELPEEEAKPLVLAATGSPYLIIVKDEDGCFISSESEDFEMSAVFDLIKLHARDDADFKKALVDYVIDLSREC